MTANEITIGRKLVLRGLVRDSHGPGLRPPAIGKVVTTPVEGKFRVKLSLALGNWSPRARTVTMENVDREATPREVAMGMVL
jgi:hypothetical protein